MPSKEALGTKTKKGTRQSPSHPVLTTKVTKDEKNSLCDQYN
jgi:hypothetical protein